MGSFVPFAMFTAWNAVVLGMIDADMSSHDVDPIERLRNGSAGSAPAVLANIFAFLAVMTSFIGFVYGLMSFLTDVFPHRDKRVIVVCVFDVGQLPNFPRQ